MRRLLLLVSVPLVLLAFSGPAVAQASSPYWYQGEEKLPTYEERSFASEGTISININGGRVDCEVYLTGQLWNDEDGGVGSVTGAGFYNQNGPNYDCFVWFSDCYADVTSATSQDPWEISLSEGKEGSIDFTFSNALIDGDFYGLGNEWCNTIFTHTWGGEFTGTIEGGDITFAKSKTTGAPNPATVDANMPLSGGFTAEMEEE